MLFLWCILTIAEPEALLLLDFNATGISEAQALQMNDFAALALQDFSHYTVLQKKDIAALLTLNKTQESLACVKNSKCLTSLKTKWVLNGTVSFLNNEYWVTVSLLNAEEAQRVASASLSTQHFQYIPSLLKTLLNEILNREQQPKSPVKVQSLAVFDLKILGFEESLEQSLTQVLATELKKQNNIEVISRDDIMALLGVERLKESLGCADDSCLAAIGGALGVEKLVVGHVLQLNNQYVISLRLLDALHVQVDNRVTEIFSGQKEQLLYAVRAAGRKLLDKTVIGEGTLSISSPQNHTEVFLNEQKIGVLPMAPLNTAVGKQSLRLSKSGFNDFLTDIYIEPFETTVVWAELTSQPLKWYQKWWVWTIAGSLAIAGGTVWYVASRPASSQSSGKVVLP